MLVCGCVDGGGSPFRKLKSPARSLRERPLPASQILNEFVDNLAVATGDSAIRSVRDQLYGFPAVANVTHPRRASSSKVNPPTWGDSDVPSYHASPGEQ